MKNYASKRAKRGKLAYRTPDRFIYKQVLRAVKAKCRINPVGEFRKKISSEFSTISPRARSSEILLRGKEKIRALYKTSKSFVGLEQKSQRDFWYRAHIFIAGHVQGVFFRNETCKKAKEVGLTGWIRNLEDGRVEAVFEGEKEKVEKIIEWLKRGPILAKVEKVEVIFEDYKGEFKSFETR